MYNKAWRDVFKSDKLNRKLKKDGVVKFSLQNFNADDCESFLQKTVPDYQNNIGNDFYASVTLTDLVLKKKIHNGLAQLINPGLENQLINHKLLSHCFLVKTKGVKSLLRLHQDWSIVDERKYRGYNLWIPLSDSTIKNGTLYVIKGSHKFPLNIRGGAIESKYLCTFDEAKKYLIPVKVKVGEALIFDNQLLHYSPANYTEKSRTAIVNNIVPNEAETLCFHFSDENSKPKVNRYRVPSDFFINYPNFLKDKDLPHPHGEFIEEIDYGNIAPPTIEEFKQLIKEHGIKRRSWFFSNADLV